MQEISIRQVALGRLFYYGFFVLMAMRLPGALFAGIGTAALVQSAYSAFAPLLDLGLWSIATESMGLGPLAEIGEIVSNLRRLGVALPIVVALASVVGGALLQALLLVLGGWVYNALVRKGGLSFTVVTSGGLSGATVAPAAGAYSAQPQPMPQFQAQAVAQQPALYQQPAQQPAQFNPVHPAQQAQPPQVVQPGPVAHYPPAAQPPSPAPAAWVLQGIAPITQRWPLAAPRVTVGSALDNAIVLSELAPYHAEFRQEGGRLVVYAVNAQPLTVNDRPVPDANLLKPGFQVRVGPYLFVVERQ